MKTLRIGLNDGSLLCMASVADTFVTRGVGLLTKKHLEPEEGLLISPCTSVHTYFMRFPIDVLFIDAQDTVVRIRSLKSFRFSLGGKGAKKVLEIPYGSAAAHSVAVGNKLSLSPAGEPVAT